MKKQFKQMVISMAAFMAAMGAGAWEKMTEADRDTTVRIVKKTDYVKPEKATGMKVESKYISGSIPMYGEVHSARFSANGSLRGTVGSGSISDASIKSHQYTDLYLDLDDKPTTVEGIATICTDCPDVKMDLYNMEGTNNTLTVGQIMDLGKHNCAHKHDVEVMRRSLEQPKKEEEISKKPVAESSATSVKNTISEPLKEGDKKGKDDTVTEPTPKTTEDNSTSTLKNEENKKEKDDKVTEPTPKTTGKNSTSTLKKEENKKGKNSPLTKNTPKPAEDDINDAATVARFLASVFITIVSGTFFMNSMPKISDGKGSIKGNKKDWMLAVAHGGMALFGAFATLYSWNYPVREKKNNEPKKDPVVAVSKANTNQTVVVNRQNQATNITTQVYRDRAKQME